MEAIISALIGAAGAIIVCVIQSNAQHQKQQAQFDKAIGLIEYKIDELTTKVEKHNNLVERTYKLEEMATLHEEKIKVANEVASSLGLGQGKKAFVAIMTAQYASNGTYFMNIFHWDCFLHKILPCFTVNDMPAIISEYITSCIPQIQFVSDSPDTDNGTSRCKNNLYSFFLCLMYGFFIHLRYLLFIVRKRSIQIQG